MTSARQPRSASAGCVVVTGATGFLGRRLCVYFQSRGWRVRGLVRDVLRHPFGEGSVEARLCDLPDRVDASAFESVDAVIHCAYASREASLREARRVNELGTERVYALSRAAGVRQFVFISSTSAHDEALSYYGRSKLEAERAVLAAKDRLHVTVVRPPLIYGPRDRETLAFFTSVRNGVLPMTGDGTNTLSVVYVEDCAAAVVRVLHAQGVPSGRSYFVDDGSVYVWRDALKEIETALGRRALVRFGMPLAVVKVAAAATQLWGKMTNTAQMLTLDKVNELTQPHWVCSGAGARRELGWEPRVQWAQGVQEAVKWYRAEGWL